MTIDDCICEKCLSKNHCDVLPYSNNCYEVRAMAKHDKQVYNKANDDFMEKVELKSLGVHPDELCNKYYPRDICKQIKEIAEQLKAGGKNE